MSFKLDQMVETIIEPIPRIGTKARIRSIVVNTTRIFPVPKEIEVEVGKEFRIKVTVYNEGDLKGDLFLEKIDARTGEPFEPDTIVRGVNPDEGFTVNIPFTITEEGAELLFRAGHFEDDRKIVDHEAKITLKPKVVKKVPAKIPVWLIILILILIILMARRR